MKESETHAPMITGRYAQMLEDASFSKRTADPATREYHLALDVLSLLHDLGMGAASVVLAEQEKEQR